MLKNYADLQNVRQKILNCFFFQRLLKLLTILYTDVIEEA